MADEPSAKDTPEPASKDDAKIDDPVVAQADNPDAVKHALSAERAAKKAAEKRANELAAKVEEFENQNRSELERLTAKVTKAEQAKGEAETRLLRYEIAAEKQVPADALDLLNGTTREELEASADKILNLVKSRTDTDKAPDFDGGAREPAPDADPATAHNREVLKLLGIST
jgi:hydroxylamine reductase (hybrid-cluster protein)